MGPDTQRMNGPIPDGERRPRLRRSWPLKSYVVGLVALVVLAAGVNVVYQRRAAADDAGRSATADAQFAADTAARSLASSVDLVRRTVAAAAATPGLEAALAGPTSCTLTFGSAGALSSGHLDVVGMDGAVGCSSLDRVGSPVYADAAWLADAIASPMLVGPVVDGRTDKQVMVASAPLAGGGGAVVAFLNLDAVGLGLASEFGGPRDLEFILTGAAGDVVLARSVDSARWVGQPVAGSPFAAAAGEAPRRDVDGLSRLYGEATVERLNWHVFAGANSSDALASANRISNRQLAITLGGLVVLLAAAFVLHRRVARPIAKLSSGVRSATAHTSSGPISVRGPAEISRLADDFNRLIEAANRELEATARLAAMVESSADAIIGETVDEVVTSWNAASANMFGYSSDEIVGRNIAMLVPVAQVDESASILDRVRGGGQVEQFETTRLRKDGATLDVSMTVSPIRDGDGAVIGVSTVSRDVTEHHRAETERRTLEDRLRQSERLESVGQLAGGIAHDFNNLLSIILNYAAFVASETHDEAAVLSDIAQVQAAGERAARLTKQLLTVARRDNIETETLDLNAMVADLEEMFSRTIGEHIDLVVMLAAGPTLIQSDRGQIEQVLLNLVLNARDAMPDGGTLTIETRHNQLDEEYARLHPGAAPGQHVQLAVSDTGIGMVADVASHIFEPFFTTKAKGHGTGLGLATVHGIVTAAGGAMSVYSEQSIGTTFRLNFPASDVPVDSAMEAAPDAHGNGETILVVEDEAAVLELTSRILRHAGYTVLEAATFEVALSLAAANDFQLLLTDSVMPHMSGRVLAQQIDVLKPGRAVLFMSGYSEGVVIPQGLLDHYSDLIQKPFDRRTLITHVQAALASPSPTDRVSPVPLGG
jgi:PAS domain S-box-containing protein